jgi:hypothetical protein
MALSVGLEFAAMAAKQPRLFSDSFEVPPGGLSATRYQDPDERLAGRLAAPDRRFDLG